jgi:hypothetical protein
MRRLANACKAADEGHRRQPTGGRFLDSSYQHHDALSISERLDTVRAVELSSAPFCTARADENGARNARKRP